MPKDRRNLQLLARAMRSARTIFRTVVIEIAQLRRPDKASNDSRHMNVAQAAKFLGVSTSCVHKKSSSGLLPSYKVGKRLEFEVGDLQKFREAKRRGKTS
jgi:hypothetical protein